MSGTKAVLCLVFLALGVSEAGFLDSLGKCSIKDSECQKDLFETTLIKYADTGVPEFDIPALKPFRARNVSISILGLVEMSVTNGFVEGIPDCHIIELKTDVDNGVTTAETFCNQITLNGHYTITPGTLLKFLTGSSLEGDGNGLIQINKMTLKMKIPFNIEKHEDGEIYIRPIGKDSEYSTDVTESITFAADNVIMGGEEVSNRMIQFMNDNWRFMLKTFGRFFSDKIMEEYYDRMEVLFGTRVRAKDIFSDDLSRYVKQ